MYRGNTNEAIGPSGGMRSIDCAEQTKLEVQRHTESREGHKSLFKSANDIEVQVRNLITVPPMYLMDEIEEDLLEIARIAQKLGIWAEKRVTEQDKVLTELRAKAQEAADGSS